MLCDGLYVGFEGVSLAGQRAVEILPLQWLDNKGGVFERRPFASHYTEPKQPIRVDLDSLRSLTQASRVIKSIQKAVQKARAEAQAHQVVRLVVQSVVAEKADKQQRRGDRMKREGDAAIALGGSRKGVQAVITAADRNRARPEKETVYLAKDSLVPTEFAERIEQQDLKGGRFSEIRAKRDTKLEICDVKDTMVEADEELTLTAVKDCIQDACGRNILCSRPWKQKTVPMWSSGGTAHH